MTDQEIIIKGTPICRGVAIGIPLFVSFADDPAPDYSIAPEEVEAELCRYQNAVHKSREELKGLQKRLEQQRILEGVSILESQLQMLHDPSLTTKIEKAIRQSRKNAEIILHALTEEYENKFNALSDAFFRERFKDLQDISRRIMGHLRPTKRVSLANVPPDTVVFSRELNASDTEEANLAGVSALVTELGGATSHAAIVAKARGTPFVSSIPFEYLASQKFSLAIVDGRTGEIILNPSQNTLQKYQTIRSQLQYHMHQLSHIGPLKTETIDGYAVRLSANIEMAGEFDLLRQHGGQGVGLYRSEYIFLNKNSFPSEEEQYINYRMLVDKAQGLPIVIRTFDIGGDKILPDQQSACEGNPFLGCRAIRYLLKEVDVFKTQLRAILRASYDGDVSIMFPMVSTLCELLDAKKIVQEVQQELTAKGQKFGKIRIGCMIEVPSAAIIADMLAKECDFLSIGTNDLVQYALAVDRSNDAMRELYKPTHPSILRLIKLIIHEASHAGIPVTICGEVAADPRFTPLLLGLGVHELSVATRYIPAVKHAIRRTSIVGASQLAEKALSLKTAAEIQELLTEEYKRNVPEDCFYNY